MFNYKEDDDRYLNPPPVTEAQGAPESHTLASEEFEDMINKKNPRDGDRQMSIMEAVKATRVPKSGSSSKYFFEIFTYVAFLGVLITVSFAVASTQSFFYTKILGDTFRDAVTEKGISFNTIVEIDDIWDFLDQILIRGLYWDNVVWNVTEQGMVLYENKLLGHPTIRMLKVANDSCTVVESFSREIKECFANYRPHLEDTTSFGPDEENEYVWTSAEDLETYPILGDVTKYGGGGFVVPLPLDDPNEARSIIKALRDQRWIDRGSRALIIDFALYNGNVNLFSAVRMLFELPATGGVIPRSSFYSTELMRYEGNRGNFCIAMEGIFCGFILFFIFEELLEIIRVRLRYFLSYSNHLDLAILSLAVASIGLSYYRGRVAERRINKIIESKLTKAHLDDVVEAETYYMNVTSILLFTAWVKAFKYISVNRTMSQLSSTLSRSSKDIGGFGIMFSIFFFAYAQFGYLVFGTQIEDYSTFYGSVFALLRTILGDFDYPALEKANRILGPLFFITYVFFVFFVLLNMFLAIINDSYVEVKAELAKHEDNRGIFKWIKERMAALSKKKKDGHPESPQDEHVSYDDYKKQLMLAGFRQEDIDSTFTKLNIESDHRVSEKMMDKISGEMEEMVAVRRDIRDDHTQYLIVNRRVDALESALVASIRRLETVMEGMAGTEERKVSAQENTNKMEMKNDLYPVEYQDR